MLASLRLALACTLAGASLAPIAATFAQPAWPSRQIRFVVPFPPGGPSDVVARIVAPRLQGRLGQPVVVDNRPGAGTQIGTEFVAKSAPDGYTLFLGSIVHAINVGLYAKLPYDPMKDFTMITVLAATPSLLVVHPSLPVKSVADLIALGKKRPGTGRTIGKQQSRFTMKPGHAEQPGLIAAPGIDLFRIALRAAPDHREVGLGVAIDLVAGHDSLRSGQNARTLHAADHAQETPG